METRTQQSQPRGVAGTVHAVRTLEGAGFEVRRPFPTPALDHFDPFLLLDHMGPTNYPPGQVQGAPDHPHRGFETVSYILEGELEHEDSTGRSGRLGPGDVQWMTAGAGVVHSEMPSRRMQVDGGRIQGLQLWVNLPRRDKLMAPRYQEVPSEGIPVGKSADGRVRVKVIAGEALGQKAVIETRTPIFYLHFTLAPGARHVQAAPRDHNVFAYVLGGEARVAGTPVAEGDAVFLRRDGDTVELSTEGTDGVELLLIGGRPLHEPVARYGPFVMNTRQELLQAIEDYQSGRMGEITQGR